MEVNREDDKVFHRVMSEWWDSAAEAWGSQLARLGTNNRLCHDKKHNTTPIHTQAHTHTRARTRRHREEHAAGSRWRLVRKHVRGASCSCERHVIQNMPNTARSRWRAAPRKNDNAATRSRWRHVRMFTSAPSTDKHTRAQIHRASRWQPVPTRRCSGAIGSAQSDTPLPERKKPVYALPIS